MPVASWHHSHVANIMASETCHKRHSTTDVSSHYETKDIPIKLLYASDATKITGNPRLSMTDITR